MSLDWLIEQTIKPMQYLTFVHLDVNRAPPDVVLAGVLKDDTLVFGRTAGLLPREVDQGTVRGDDSTLITDGIFVELGNRCIAIEHNLFQGEGGKCVDDDLT
jgi:hypothetical protein